MDKILIVGAHFDDAELGVGGTAAKLVSEGKKVYKLTLTVNELPTSYENQTELVCPGDSVELNGRFYKKGEHEIVLHNIYGGDSVINLTVSELPIYFIEESRTQFVGQSGTWRGKDLSIYGVGEHIVYDSLKTVVYDCDSVFALTLTIEALPTSETEVRAQVCPGETIEYDGHNYGAGVHNLRYQNMLGGDSVIKLMISNYPVYEDPLQIIEIYQGTNQLWNGHQLADYAVGVYRHRGCGGVVETRAQPRRCG